MMRHTFTQPRVKIFSIFLLVIGIVFVMRLFYLQVIRHDFYTARASAEQVKTLTLPADRGELYVMNDGKPHKIVMNETVYNVVADPKITESDKEIAQTINSVAGGAAKSDISQRLEKKDTRYQVLATNLTRSQAQKIKEEKYAGVLLQPGTRRSYPEKELAAQTLGFVDSDGDGQYGVESALNKRLKGKDGLLKSVTDIANVPLTIGKDNIDQPAEHGDNVVLTIDRKVQSKVEQIIKTKRRDIPHKSVIVMDPNNGHILAMANTPSYNPEKYSQVKDISRFNNNIISDPYEPGSVMKAFTVAMGLDRKVITPNATFNNTDNVKVGDWDITNATKGYTGETTFQRALAFSLNTGMVEIAMRMDNGEYVGDTARRLMYRYLHDRFQLGQSTGIELAGEAGGTIISPDNHEGNAIRYANMSFGQGMDLTMLQVASGFSSIVNGGTYYQPSIVAGTIRDQSFQPDTSKKATKNVLSSQASKTARKMIHDARASVHSQSDRKGFYVGGKTGTGETALNGKYSMDTTVATYLGFGGEVGKSPDYVIMVRTSGDGMNLQGNLDAMPIFTDISNWLLENRKLVPEK